MYDDKNHKSQTIPNIIYKIHAPVEVRVIVDRLYPRLIIKVSTPVISSLVNQMNEFQTVDHGLFISIILGSLE